MLVLQYMRLPRQKKNFKVCKPCVTHKMCKTGMNCQVPTINNQDKLTIGYKEGDQNETWVRNEEKGQEKREEEVVPFTKYSPKQKKLAKVASPRTKITAADFKKLSKKKKSKRAKV